MSLGNLPLEILEQLEDQIKTMNSVQKFLKSGGLYRRLRNFSKTVNGSGRDGNLILNAGGGSYTDGKSVTVGLPELMFEDSNEIKLNVLKALVAHEYGHLKYSDFTVFRQIQERTKELFAKEYQIPMGEKIGANLLNCTEDGRMEKLQANDLPGLLKYFQYMNLRFHQEFKVGEDSLNDFIMTIAYVSVSGLVPNNFDEVYGGSEMEDAVNSCKPFIIKAINTTSPKQCADITYDMIEAHSDFIASLMEKSMEEAEQNGESSSLEEMSSESEYSGKPSEGRTNQGQSQSGKRVEVHVVPESQNATNPQPNKSDEDQQEEDSDESQSSPGKTSKDEAEVGGSNGSNSESGDESNAGDEEESENGSSKEEGNGEEQESGSSSDESGEDTEDGQGATQGSLFDDFDDEEGEGDSKGSADESNGGADEDSTDESSDESNGKSEGDSSDKEGNSSDSTSEIDDEEKSEKAASDLGKFEKTPDLVNNTDNIDLKEEAFDVKAALEAMKEKFEDENKEVIQDINTEDKRQQQREDREEKEREQFQVDDKTLSLIMGSDYERKSFRYRSADLSNTTPMPSLLKLQGKNLKKQLTKILQNKSGINRSNTRVGIFDHNQAHRFVTGDVDLFKRYGTPEDTDYAFSILCDNSGSMSSHVEDESGKVVGTKVEKVREACAVIEEGLNGLVPFKIQQFDSYSNVNADEVRGWQDKTKENLSWKLSTRTGGGNADGFSIRVAAQELLNRPEKQKVLIVMSDGLPSDYRSLPQALNHVQESVKEARKNGIRVIAIRFGSNRELTTTTKEYKHMYERDFITCAPKDIQKELVKVLKNVTRN